MLAVLKEVLEARLRAAHLHVVAPPLTARLPPPGNQLCTALLPRCMPTPNMARCTCSQLQLLVSSFLCGVEIYLLTISTLQSYLCLL